MRTSVWTTATSGRFAARWAVATMSAVAAGVVGALCTPAPAAGAVGQASPAMSITASPSTNVGLQIFANVNLSGGANPTGTIAFRLFGPGDNACGSAIFTSNVAVTGISLNSGHFTTGRAGTYHWQASYSGDVNNAASGPTSCTAPPAAVIVSPTFTGLSVTAQPAAAGTIRAIATIGGFHPTGTITFLLAPPGDQFCAANPVFTSRVPVSGAAPYSSAPYTPTATGNYKWRVMYDGDVNNYHAGPTACLDPNAAVTVNQLSAPPAPTPTNPTVPSAPTIPATSRPTAPASTAPPVTHPAGNAPSSTAPTTTAARPATAAPASGAPAPTTGATSSVAADRGPATASLNAIHPGAAASSLWWLAAAGAVVVAAGCGALFLWGRRRHSAVRS